MQTRHCRLTLSLIVAVLTATAPALAQPHRRGPDFHGRDFGHLSQHEHLAWRGGVWFHGWHGGRFAWWWRTGGFWYFYPEPVYPYPTYIPPAIVMQQAPPVPTGLPPAQYWHYCDNPKGYYPYVASCNGAWREVPATPPNAPGQ